MFVVATPARRSLLHLTQLPGTSAGARKQPERRSSDKAAPQKAAEAPLTSLPGGQRRYNLHPLRY